MTDEQADGENAPPRPADPDRSVPDPFDGPEWVESRRRRTRSSGASSSSVVSDDVDERDADGAEPAQRVRRRSSAYLKRKRRNRILLITGGVGLVVVAAVAWLAYTSLRARHELEAVRSEVRQLRSQISAADLDAARATARDLRTHAREAHDLTTGPVWAGAAALPWLGDPLDSARAITSSVDQVADTALPALVEASQGLDPAKVRRPDGSIDFASISDVAPQIVQAADALNSALDGIHAAPSSTWLGSVDSARGDLLDQLGQLSTTVDSASVAAQVLPSMLGADGPRNYMIGFQNEAEVRGTGGLPGAFAILQVDKGKFRFTGFESDNTLVKVGTGLDFGEDFDRLWNGSDATSDYRDSNVSPNFPYAAQVWVAQWEAVSGQRLDGAITLDPTALSYLLKVTGPVTMADGVRVSASNVVALTQNKVYLQYGRAGNDARKKFLLELAKTVSKHLVETKADTAGLVRAAAHAASEYRLLVWSVHEDEEKLLEPTKISGTVPNTSAPYAGLALNNAAANKLDYYLDTSLDIQRSGCGSSRAVTVTIKVHNGTPSGGLTDYVYGNFKPAGLPPGRGSNVTLVSYYATQGALLTGISLDGKPSAIMSGYERGHPVFTYRLGLARGQTATLVLHLTEPAGDGPLTVRPQPLVRPVQVSTSTESCG